MPNLFIVRGIPGSGKTTFAHSICENVVSADDYFVHNNTYKFDPSKLDKAHSYCFNKTKELMENGKNVAVANTFTKQWEMENYFKLAKEMNYMVFSVIVENRHQSISVHSISEKTIDNMRNRFEVVL